MKALKIISILATLLLAACLLTCFTVNAAEVTAEFSELKGVEEGILSSDSFSAAISSRAGAESGTSDLRIVIVANYELLSTNKDASLVVTLGGKTFTKSIVEELEVYQSAKAADKTYVAAEGSVLTGFVITGVPNADWDEVTVTLSIKECKYTGSQIKGVIVNYAAAIEIDKGNWTLPLEKHLPYNGYLPSIAFMASKTSTAELKVNAYAATQAIYQNPENYIVKVKIYGKIYTSERIEAASENNLRVSLEGLNILDENGQPLDLYAMNGEMLPIQYLIYGTDGDLLYYSGTYNHEINFVANIGYAPVGLEKATVDVSTLGISGNLNAPTDPLEQLFDGNLTKKYCAWVSKNQGSKHEITFALTEAATLSHYTFTTGNDTAKYPYRNPVSWELYGLVNEEWVLLDEVAESTMEAVNTIPYTFEIDKLQSCKEYKIVLHAERESGTPQLQLAELELFKAAE